MKQPKVARWLKKYGFCLVNTRTRLRFNLLPSDIDERRVDFLEGFDDSDNYLQRRRTPLIF